nr:hypothetical protein Iba_chr02bCG25110 [Ipomoea batatas]GMC61978.1 hypothetical protein Iba_chr02bCG25160 [Ipomoea batatas]
MRILSSCREMYHYILKLLEKAKSAEKIPNEVDDSLGDESKEYQNCQQQHKQNSIPYPPCNSTSIAKHHKVLKPFLNSKDNQVQQQENDSRYIHFTPDQALALDHGIEAMHISKHRHHTVGRNDEGFRIQRRKKAGGEEEGGGGNLWLGSQMRRSNRCRGTEFSFQVSDEA